MLVLSSWFYIKLISCYFLFTFPLDKVVILYRATHVLITLGKVKDTECFVSSLYLHQPIYTCHCFQCMANCRFSDNILKKLNRESLTAGKQYLTVRLCGFHSVTECSQTGKIVLIQVYSVSSHLSSSCWEAANVVILTILVESLQFRMVKLH